MKNYLKPIIGIILTFLGVFIAFKADMIFKYIIGIIITSIGVVLIMKKVMINY